MAERCDQHPGGPERPAGGDVPGHALAAADAGEDDTLDVASTPGTARAPDAAPMGDDEVARSVAASLSTPPPGTHDWGPPRWANDDAPVPSGTRPAAEGPLAASRAGGAGGAPPTAATTPRARPAVRSGTLAFGLAFLLLGALGLLEPLDVDFETAWLWAAAPVALGLATMIAVIRRALTTSG